MLSTAERDFVWACAYDANCAAALAANDPPASHCPGCTEACGQCHITEESPLD